MMLLSSRTNLTMIQREKTQSHQVSATDGAYKIKHAISKKKQEKQRRKEKREKREMSLQ